jgi:hypothetical protein
VRRVTRPMREREAESAAVGWFRSISELMGRGLRGRTGNTFRRTLRCTYASLSLPSHSAKCAVASRLELEVAKGFSEDEREWRQHRL